MLIKTDWWKYLCLGIKTNVYETEEAGGCNNKEANKNDGKGEHV